MRGLILIAIFLVCFLRISSQSKYFNSFSNTTNLICSDKDTVNFYYQLEKDTIIENINLYRFRIGENKYNSISFWLGVKENTIYSLKIDNKFKILDTIVLTEKSRRKKKFYLEKKSIQIKQIDYEKLSERKIYNDDYFFTICKFNNRLNNQFIDKVNIYSFHLSLDRGIDFNFNYNDKINPLLDIPPYIPINTVHH